MNKRKVNPHAWERRAQEFFLEKEKMWRKLGQRKMASWYKKKANKMEDSVADRERVAKEDEIKAARKKISTRPLI